uniref:hypothetical protein n=1 Tax=Carnobacterium sp. TaxID=48221 RepID=UPI0015EF1E10|nr:hypothetical protein [Carnobacterium sp.]
MNQFILDSIAINLFLKKLESNDKQIDKLQMLVDQSTSTQNGQTKKQPNQTTSASLEAEKIESNPPPIIKRFFSRLFEKQNS